MLCLLGSCGGGGGSAPATGNQPPVFTSAATAVTAENNTGVVYTAVATGAAGRSLTYSIGGGPDAALFNITTDGRLSFVAAPDFETPKDADGNNIYRVQIDASDGSAKTSLTVDVTVTNVPDLVTVRRVATGFVQSRALVAYPDTSGRVAVVEKAGRIRLLDPASGATTLFLDISAQVSTLGDRGLLGVAFAPDFATSRAFYVYMNTTTGAVEIRRYQAQAAAASADPASGSLVMTFTMPSAFHQGGWIAFGPDNYLYLGTGDGVATRALGNGASEAAQSSMSLLGKILRIDPAKDDFPADANRNYAIPPTNPLALGMLPEIWTLGLRSLEHASFDDKDLWLSDSGQSFKDEIDRLYDGQVVKLAGMGLRTSFGWPYFEGTTRYSDAGLGLTGCCQAPVYEIAHNSPSVQGGALVGGLVYRGPIAALKGEYVFAVSADLYSFKLSDVPLSAGTIGGPAGISPSAVRIRTADFVPDIGSFTAISAFGTDNSGNIFILDSDGEIFVIEGK